jgi:hypothetical protein
VGVKWQGKDILQSRLLVIYVKQRYYRLKRSGKNYWRRSAVWSYADLIYPKN